MNKAQNTFITPSQLTFTLKSAIVGIDIMYLPNEIIKIAKQDSWISCILGIMYPLYVVFIASYLCKKSPNDNILILSKRCFGNIIGNILNVIFVSFFFLMLTSELSGFSNIFRVYTTPFLKNYKVLLTALIPIAFTSYKGMKPLGRLNEAGFYLTIIIIFFPIGILSVGSFLNIMPVFGSGLGNIMKGTGGAVGAYSGMEIILLFYPFLNDKKKLLNCGLAGTAIVSFIYLWVVFGTIFYLGINISQKYLWPVLALSDSINIPIINSFRFIFLSLWSLVEFKCISTYYFATSYSLNQLIKKIPAETFTLLLYPMIIVITLLFGTTTMRRNYTEKLIPLYAIYNLSYITIVAILIYFKKGDKYEKT